MPLGIKLREFDNLHVQGSWKPYETFNVATLLAEECTKPKWGVLLETPCIIQYYVMNIPVVLVT